MPRAPSRSRASALSPPSPLARRRHRVSRHLAGIERQDAHHVRHPPARPCTRDWRRLPLAGMARRRSRRTAPAVIAKARLDAALAMRARLRAAHLAQAIPAAAAAMISDLTHASTIAAWKESVLIRKAHMRSRTSALRSTPRLQRSPSTGHIACHRAKFWPTRPLRRCCLQRSRALAQRTLPLVAATQAQRWPPRCVSDQSLRARVDQSARPLLSRSLCKESTPRGRSPSCKAGSALSRDAWRWQRCPQRSICESDDIGQGSRRLAIAAARSPLSSPASDSRSRAHRSMTRLYRPAPIWDA